MERQFDFKRGFIDGLPIGLAYLAVSFSFGIYAVQHGMPYWLATILSASNITSAGQFAGVTMMAEMAAIVEIFFTVLVINARYFLMSLSLSQQLDEKTPAWKRLIMAYFITESCIGCNACLSKCPQQIRIPNQMSRIVELLRK